MMDLGDTSAAPRLTIRQALYALRVVHKAGSGTPEQLGLGEMSLKHLMDKGVLTRTSKGKFTLTPAGHDWMMANGGPFK